MRVLDLGLERDGVGEAMLVVARQGLERHLPALGDLGRGAVGAEEAVLAELVEGDELGEAARDAGVAGKGGMLGARQLQAPAGPGDRRGGASRAGACEEVGEKLRIHAATMNPRKTTET